MTLSQPLSATLLGVTSPSKHQKWSIRDSIAELAELARTAGFEVDQTIIQNRQLPHQKFYIGKGKLDELLVSIKDHQTKVLITDDELTPSQHKYLESFLNIKVIDRTGLILEIFAQRAQTSEAKLQVELAQLEYLYPRLTRLWTHLSRQNGGIGTRGPGETQLEVDRRQINDRILTIKKKLKKVSNNGLFPFL